MDKDNKKIEEENLSKDKEKKDSAKDGFAAGLGGGFHAANLANKEKESSEDNSSNNNGKAILIILGLGIIIIALVAIFFF